MACKMQVMAVKYFPADQPGAIRFMEVNIPSTADVDESLELEFETDAAAAAAAPRSSSAGSSPRGQDVNNEEQRISEGDESSSSSDKPEMHTQRVQGAVTSNFLSGFKECQFCTKLLLPTVWKHHEKQCSARLNDIVPGYCVACKKDFKTSGLLAKHGLEHCKEGTIVCLFCNNRKLHYVSSTISSNNNDSYEEEAAELNMLKKHIYHSHAFRVKKFPYRCNLCDEVCENRKSMEYHLLMHQHDEAPITKDCESEPEDIKPSVDDLNKMMMMQDEASRNQDKKEIRVSYCPTCKGKEFGNSKLLDRHLRKFHGHVLSQRELMILSLKKTTSAKRHTGTILSKKEDKEKEPEQPEVEDKKDILISSEVSPVIDSVRSITLCSPLKRSFGVDDIITTCISPTKLYSRPFATPFYKRKKVKSSSSTNEVVEYQSLLSSIKKEKEDSEEAINRSSNEQAVTISCKEEEEPNRIPVNSKARLENGNFLCLKCTNYESRSEQEFYDHVKHMHVWSEEEILNRSLNGTPEKSDFWCPECDMTFLSKSTLTMHLQANHEILRDTIKYYLEQLGYEGDLPLLENQCSVCFILCDDEQGFQKHFRTHGLAFLKFQQEKRKNQKNIS